MHGNILPLPEINNNLFSSVGGQKNMGGFMNIQLQNAMMNNNQSYGMYQNNLMHTGDPRDESDCNQLY
jgi:hypothetical protein